jgi:ABC-type transport system substrate-binding protein
MSWNPALGGSRLGPADTIVYGFKSDISALSVITSEWLWDWNVLGTIYDTMISRNPYNLPDEVGALATSWSANDAYPGWPQGTVAEFTIRADATFHDGSPVKPADIAYSILLVKAAGAGNAWNYPVVMDVNKVQIAGNVVRVFFNVHSAWALHWSGFMPIINKDLWNQAVGPGTAANYNGFIADDTNGDFTPGTFGSAAAMRNYHPWEVSTYGNPAVIDLAEDGGYSWSFVSYVIGQSVTLNAFAGFYDTVSHGGAMVPRSDFVTAAFAGIGNVNYAGGYGVGHSWYTADRKIDLTGDLARIATSMPSSSSGTWGPGGNEYNPDADLNKDNAVNVIDLATAGANFNKKMG